MRTFRLFLLLSAVVAVPAFASPALEIELGAGAHGLKEAAPTVTGRLGLDLWNWFTPSFRVMSLNSLASDQQAWAMLGELRAHTRGRFQLNGGLGLGFALASFAPGDDRGVNAKVTTVNTYLQGDIGLRLTIGRFWVGLNVGGAPYQQMFMGTLNLGVRAFGGDAYD